MACCRNRASSSAVGRLGGIFVTMRYTAAPCGAPAPDARLSPKIHLPRSAQTQWRASGSRNNAFNASAWVRNLKRRYRVR
jgi:hypothetical protein